MRKGASCLVDRSEEASLCAVRTLDDAGLPVDEYAIFRDDSNLDPFASQQFVEPAIAVAVQQCLDFRRRLIPGTDLASSA